MKLRAERKAGELLKEIIPHHGGKPLDDQTVTADFGLSRFQSFRWQLEAAGSQGFPRGKV